MTSWYPCERSPFEILICFSAPTGCITLLHWMDLVGLIPMVSSFSNLPGDVCGECHSITTKIGSSASKFGLYSIVNTNHIGLQEQGSLSLWHTNKAHTNKYGCTWQMTFKNLFSVKSFCQESLSFIFHWSLFYVMSIVKWGMLPGSHCWGINLELHYIVKSLQLI